MVGLEVKGGCGTERMFSLRFLGGATSDRQSARNYAYYVSCLQGLVPSFLVLLKPSVAGKKAKEKGLGQLSSSDLWAAALQNAKQHKTS